MFQTPKLGECGVLSCAWLVPCPIKPTNRRNKADEKLRAYARTTIMVAHLSIHWAVPYVTPSSRVSPATPPFLVTLATSSRPVVSALHRCILFCYSLSTIQISRSFLSPSLKRADSFLHFWFIFQRHCFLFMQKNEKKDNEKVHLANDQLCAKVLNHYNVDISLKIVYRKLWKIFWNERRCLGLYR